MWHTSACCHRKTCNKTCTSTRASPVCRKRSIAPFRWTAPYWSAQKARGTQQDFCRQASVRGFCARYGVRPERLARIGDVVEVTELRDAVTAKVLAGLPRPVLVVDEGFQDKSSFAVGSLLRAVVRAAELAAVFMGTTANMVLPNTDKLTTTVTCNTPWAVILTKLPLFCARSPGTGVKAHSPSACTAAALQTYPGINPRNLVRFQYEVLGGRTSPEKCLARVALLLYLEKATLRGAARVRAQVQYLLNSASPTRSSALVTQHFARFPRSLHGTQLVVRGGKVRQPDGSLWDPVPEFPTVNEDPLLALLLGGPCAREDEARAAPVHPPPFVIEPNTRTVLFASQDVTLSSATALIFSLEDGASEDVPGPEQWEGSVLERIAALAVINASRACHLGQTSADLFVRNYVTELLHEAPTGGPLRWRPEAVPLSAFWTQHSAWTIPWVARVSRPGDGAAAIPALGLQSYRVTRDEDRVVGRVDPLPTETGIYGAGTPGAECVLETFAEYLDCSTGEQSLSTLCDIAQRWLGSTSTSSADPSATRQAVLGLLTVSALPKFRGAHPRSALAKRFRKVLKRANIVCIIPDERWALGVSRVNVIDSEAFRTAKPVPRDRLFCVVVCDEAVVREELQRRLTGVIDLFGVQALSGVVKKA
jgi:hypothetical protein